MKKPPPNRFPRRWWIALSLILLLVATLEICLIACAYRYYVWPRSAAAAPKRPGPRQITATGLTVIDYTGEEPRTFQLSALRAQRWQQPFLTLRERLPQAKNVEFEIHIDYSDSTKNAMAVVDEGGRKFLQCGNDREPLSPELLDFIDSAWALEIVDLLQSGKPEEFQRGMKLRDAAGTSLTNELCDQLSKAEVFDCNAVTTNLRVQLRPLAPGKRGGHYSAHHGPSLFSFVASDFSDSALVRDRLLDYVRRQHAPTRRNVGTYDSYVHERVLEILYPLIDPSYAEEFTTLLERSNASSMMRWTLLDFVRRLERLPPVEGPKSICPTGETKASLERFARAEELRATKDIQEFVALRDRLAKMGKERLKFTLDQWEAALKVRVHDVRFRTEGWYRVAELGPEVVPFALRQQEASGSLPDKAFWHTVVLHFGGKLDESLVDELMASSEWCKHELAKMVLLVSGEPFENWKHTELHLHFSGAFDGREFR